MAGHRNEHEVDVHWQRAQIAPLTDAWEQQADLLRRLRVEANYPPSVLDLFHQIRVDSNAAAHRRLGDHAKALACLKMARQLGIYCVFSNVNPHFADVEVFPLPVDALIRQRIDAPGAIALCLIICRMGRGAARDQAPRRDRACRTSRRTHRRRFANWAFHRQSKPRFIIHF
jgi:hypothetical protein